MAGPPSDEDLAAGPACFRAVFYSAAGAFYHGFAAKCSNFP